MGFGETFKALSDPVRREILTLLKNGKLAAGEIASRFDLTGATISYHLNILKRAGLVFETREKTFIYYQLNTSVLEDALLWIADLRDGAPNDLRKDTQEASMRDAAKIRRQEGRGEGGKEKGEKSCESHESA